jgi:uncharacterized membrane protein YvlD (DUF360 family)
MSDLSTGIVFLSLTVVVSLAISFSPTIIAMCRSHARLGTIFTFNFIVSIICLPLYILTTGLFIVVCVPIWIWMFVWAVMGTKRERGPNRLIKVYRHSHNF